MHGIKTNILLVGTRPIAAAATAIIGLICTADDADADAFPLNEPVLITDVRRAMGDAGLTGTLLPTLSAIADQASPIVIVVRVDSEAIEADQNVAVIGATTGGVYTGMQALLMAEAKTGQRPRIFAAPGLDTLAVTTAFLVVAAKLRGMVYARAIGADVAAVVTYAGGFAARELMLIWPNFSGLFAGDAVARAVGLRARIDEDLGWHKTISNVPVAGALGISQDVYFDIEDATTDAGLLNTGKVTTLVRSDGLRFWGNRTTSAEPLFAFESAVRTSQALQDEIAQGLRWAIDKPITGALIKDILETVNARFRALIAQGRLIGGRCWFDPALNSQVDLAAGKVTLDYDFTPTAPLEGLTLNQRITDRYYGDLAAQLGA